MKGSSRSYKNTTPLSCPVYGPGWSITEHILRSCHAHTNCLDYRSFLRHWQALALEYAKNGARLVLSARRESELERVAGCCRDAGLGADQVLVLPLDVTDWESLPGKVQTVLDTFGAIDLLVNNAGVSQRSLCKDTDMSVYQKLMDVDVMGQIALTKAVLPHMLERGSGHLAVTASVAGKVGAPMRTGYCAAKHAVMGFLTLCVLKWKARA